MALGKKKRNTQRKEKPAKAAKRDKALIKAVEKPAKAAKRDNDKENKESAPSPDAPDASERLAA